MNWSDYIISRNFYNRNPVTVAQELLGKLLVRQMNDAFLVGKIVETEAYLPAGDSAAHNFKGKTKRNGSLYKDAGHAYVHSMRQYHLIDIVTEGVDIPGSVLIRALEPVEGIECMKKLRNEDRLENITNGPGKVCMALGITKEQDGVDITDTETGLFIVDDVNNSVGSKGLISTSPRVGISTAKDEPLRFWITGNAFVSKAPKVV